MKTLYNETHTKTDVYCYDINGGGEYRIQESGTVKIFFENNKFVSASFPFRDTYTRNCWRILAEINERIAEIESRLMTEIKVE